MNSLRHKVKVSLKVGVIIVIITTILIVSGCEPSNDDRKKNSHETTLNEIVQHPEINDWEDD